jgi:hypothetical protein
MLWNSDRNIFALAEPKLECIPLPDLDPEPTKNGTQKKQHKKATKKIKNERPTFLANYAASNIEKARLFCKHFFGC